MTAIWNASHKVRVRIFVIACIMLSALLLDGLLSAKESPMVITISDNNGVQAIIVER